MISQAALSLTFSEVHTVEYFTKIADQVVEMGTDEICIKDMAGIGRPAFLGKLVKNIRKDIQKFRYSIMVMRVRVFRWHQFWKLPAQALNILMLAWSHFPGEQVMRMCLPCRLC